MDEDPQKAVLRPRRPGESLKVAETVLKRRDRNLKVQADRQEAIAKSKKQQKLSQKGKLDIIRAERLVKDCRNRTKDRRRLMNCGKKPLPKQQKGKVIAAIRNGKLGGSKESKATLRTLGLGRRHTLVFLPNTKETASKLRIAQPYAFWGVPTFKMVENLIHKRAHFKDPEKPQERTALSDNVLIEQHLGDLGLVCTEDLVHSIFTCSNKFPKVTERLWPIILGDAKKSSGKLVSDKHYTTGNVKEDVNTKVAELLGDKME